MESAVNEIRAGKQDFRFYLGQCVLKFAHHDELILSCTEYFKEKVANIEGAFRRNGYAKIDKKFVSIDKEGFEHVEWDDKTTQEIIDEDTGRKKRVKVYKIILLKNPDFFQYTQKPDKESIIA